MTLQYNESSRNKVRLLIKQIFLEKPNHQFTNTQIQKILFKLKLSLKDKYPDYPVYEFMPSYWYYEGPFSPPVSDGISTMVLSKQLKPSKYRGRWKLAEGTDHANHGLEPLVVNELRSILKPFNSWADFDRFGEQIYQNAPSKFMPLYKYGYLARLRKFIRKMGRGQIPLSTDFLSESEDILYESERNIPKKEDFSQFKRFFSSFVTDAVTVFDHMQDNWNYDLLEETHIMSENVWKRFAEGIRIQDNAHDPPFESDKQGWRDIFSTRQEELRPLLNDFTLKVLARTESGEPRECDDATTRQIISAIANGYFSSEGFR